LSSKKISIGPAATEKHFVKRADKYNHSSSWVDDGQLIERMRSLASVSPEAVILDIATGTGKIAQAFYGQVQKVVGMDICPSMATQALSFLNHMVLTPAEKLSFKDEVFDACLCRQGLQFMELNCAISEISRVLKSGGRLVLCHLTAYGQIDKDEAFVIQGLRNPARKNFFLPEDLPRLLSKYGFQQIEVFEYLSVESVNRWIDNGALSRQAQEKIRELYRKSSPGFRKVHDLKFEKEDILDTMKMLIVKAVKKGERCPR